MTWLLIGVLLAWTAVAVPAALVIGRVIRTADGRRADDFNVRAVQEARVVATAIPPSEVVSAPWISPATVASNPPPSTMRPRPAIVRHSVPRT